MHTAADTLNDLDAYKTPLLPTRLRMASSAVGEGSTSVIPDMLRYNKVKAPAPSRKRRGEKDEDLLLGLRRKKGAEKQAKDNENTPYAGKAGYKKLLARGKVPGDEVDDDVAPTAEVRDTMEEDMPVQEPVKGANLGEKATPAAVPTHEDESEPRDPFDLPPAEVPFAPAVFNPTVAAAGSVGPSSLRVGRSKTGRNHNSVQIARTPIRPSPKTGGARFTAVIEDDDESMDAPEGDEPLKPLYTPPAGFSFGSPAQVRFFVVFFANLP